MTRETKIGLLVGLAFLLVVGILLSEHITGATDRPAAPLADAGHGVRTGMGAPGAAADEPTVPIPTAQDLTPRPVTPPTPAIPSSVQVTVVAPGGQTAPTPPVTHVIVENPPTDARQPVMPQPPLPPATVVSPVVLKNVTDPFANDPIGKVAAEHGEVIVPVGNPGEPAHPNTTAAREVLAQAGDTLSRLAARMPGGNTKTNRDAIVQINPVLQKDPNHVVSGRKYLLPGAAALQQASGTSPAKKAVAEQKPQQKVAVASNEASATDDAGRVYVVKAGDTLSKIASTELGSKTQVSALKAANVDVLKGGDVIKIDMKLKLPAKPLAAKAS